MRFASLLCLTIALPSSAFAAPEKDPAACASLRAQIRWIEAAARQNSTQYLTDQKKKAQDKMTDLNCSLFDK